MPWLETVPVDQRLEFLTAHRRRGYAMAELCARFGISRKTGYKWLARYDAEGRAGLHDRSRRPHTSPQRIDEETAALLAAARTAHPSWGPRKLLQYLAPRHPEMDTWPAASTVGDLLRRAGLVQGRRRRRPITHPGVVPLHTAAPNDLWTLDFKGHFKTRDGVYCYPLTLVDQHTRYLLAVHGLLSTKGEGARRVLERSFREYGLPQAIRTDNGVPFATTGIHGLSQLNVWWLRLGIQHQRIHPASPQENGAHERMHRTLKAEATRPPKATCAAQQRVFTAFRTEYNTERPHSALAGDTPAQRYTASPRVYPSRLAPFTYPAHYTVKMVTTAGTIRLRSKLLFIAHALTHEYIGLEEIDDGLWSIYVGPMLLARVSERDFILRG
jgi:transposase InsO family protein